MKGARGVDRHPLAGSMLREGALRGASGRRWQTSGDARGRELALPPNPWRVVSASN